jgi:TfoX/Sxy family transcriptional regulator of competence genes
MAYDEGLAHRIREVLSDQPNVVEKKMFGGIAFMVQGNMAVGVVKDNLMVRMDPAGYDDALAQPYVHEMDFTGRPMKGWIYILPEGIADDADLIRWIGLGVDYARSLPPK